MFLLPCLVEPGSGVIMLSVYRTVQCYDFGTLLGWSYAMVGTSDRGCHKGPCKEREKEHSVGPYCIYL